jgi:hypothetical protein
MFNKQILVVGAVALVSASLGVVITNQMNPKEVKVSLDLGNDESIDISGMMKRFGSGEARISANENAAIATLRTVAGAQQQLQASSAMDTDGDGGGEYGYFGELAGITALRIFDGAAPAIAPSNEVLDPPYLATAFGDVKNGVVERQGYYFKIFLPGTDFAGVEESPNGGTPSIRGWNSDDTELYWCCYAWPVTAGKTGNRAFFINQDGDVACTGNAAAANTRYSGLVSIPTFGAAYDNATANSMDQITGFAAMGFTANDANTWVQVGY